MKLKSLTNPPYNLFVLSALLLVISTPFYWHENADYHLNDTYIVFPFVYVGWAFALVLMVIWLIYRIVDKILLSAFLTWTHVIISFFFLLTCVGSGIWYPGIESPYSRKMHYSFQSMVGDNYAMFWIIMYLVLLFLLAQLAFVINILGGLARYIVIYFRHANKSQDPFNQ